jgi:hypothetical protein
MQSLNVENIDSIRGDENKGIFLTNKECKLLFSHKDIFIFGAGVEGENFWKDLSECINILAYIDNNRSGESFFFHGKPIISLEQCMDMRNNKQPIVITSFRYAIDIYKQLEKMGLLPGHDFYIWDEICIFHYDDLTKKYIKFLKEVWGKYKIKNAKGKIIMPFFHNHEVLWTTILAYCSNYFADKYNAEINAYFWYNLDNSKASKVIWDIYKAFNVESLIDSTKLNKIQQEEADGLCDSVWNTLSTWEDWKNITIFGINFGTSIIRDLLRFHVPCFEPKAKKMYKFLKETIQNIVFWYHYISENDIKVVLLLDGVSRDGYIRDIAITKGIPAYILCAGRMAKATLNYCERPSYPFFKKMWSELTQEEQEYGIKWAKDRIKKRLDGKLEDVNIIDRPNFSFGEGKNGTRVLSDSDKIKIIICPHRFEEDCYPYGEQIFDNNYFEWLCHLGELSEKTPDYEWYIKLHPTAQGRDTIIIDMLLERFPKITKLPIHVSPVQLKEEGAGFALTVHGTIGHEYPEIGIQVINAGINPHCAFDFNWNPKTKEEYDNLIFNLDKLDKKVNQEELYQFYSLNYLFYDWEYIPHHKLFVNNPLLTLNRLQLEASGKKVGTWQYEEYMKEWTIEKHKKIFMQLEEIFRKLDEWKPDLLYKRENCMGSKLDE